MKHTEMIKRIKEELDRFGLFYFDGNKQMGLPDIIICINGNFGAIEGKVATIRTPKQKEIFYEIEKNGGKVIIIKKKNKATQGFLIHIEDAFEELIETVDDVKDATEAALYILNRDVSEILETPKDIFS